VSSSARPSGNFKQTEGVFVTKLIVGPTLAGRIAQGLISIEDAFSIAKEVAEVLEAAHE
jgi:hypothetical protein